MSNPDVGEFDDGPPSAASSPKDMAQNAAQAVKQEAASFAADAREKAAEKIDARKETASRTLGDFANAVRKAGDELAQSDQSMATRLVRQAADGLENLARSVGEKRPEEMLEAVRDFGRRNPTAFVAGSVLAGIALGRLLRSSGAHATGQDRESTAFSAPGGAPPELGLADMDVVGAGDMGVDELAVAADEALSTEPPFDADDPQPDGRFGPRS